MKKKLSIIGLLLCVLGVLFYFLETNYLPQVFKGVWLWFLIVGSSMSFIYSFIQKRE